VLSIRVDGQQYEARGNFRVTGMTLKREGVAGQDFVHGYIEEPIVPEISGEWSIGNQLSIAQIEAITDSTVQCALANGMTYILSNAWSSGVRQIDAREGKVEVTLQGIVMQEVPTQQ
jgi:uncharacterized protein YlzI (FlbEa/FlbD family)